MRPPDVNQRSVYAICALTEVADAARLHLHGHFVYQEDPDPGSAGRAC